MTRRTASRVLRERGMATEGASSTALSLLHYLILLTGFAIALQTLGIELGALFAAGAVFAVGLGFAMQNIAQNFVAGVILLVEQSIRPGDVLEVEGTVVQVQQTGIRSTVVRSRDGEDLIVPNSILVQSTVRNFTLKDSVYRLTTSVGVAYNSDMKLVRATLEEVTDRLPWREDSPAPQVFLREFGDSAVQFDVAVWMTDPWIARRRLSDLNEAMWHALQEKGIQIAFPQVDVHFDRSAERGLVAFQGQDQQQP
ncbi:MAG: mechanosensitive ion channel [Anaerolineae bacterium]|nr:mechanosensitive ion channel [Anaerolineae bacterium]